MSNFQGWFRCHRGEMGLELLKASPHAFALLYIIAHRARWSDGFNHHGLAIGEAFIGDHASYGMTEQNYRTAKGHLAKWGFATFKPTNKGTVARIINTGIFDASPLPANGQDSGRVTDASRTGNGQVTTNKEGNNAKKEKNQGAFEIPLLLNTKAFREAWALWCQHLLEKGKPLTATAARLQLDKLAGLGEPKAIAALQHSAAMNYIGVFEPKAAAGKPAPTAQHTENSWK